jgi:hypothetical protein
MPVDPTSSGTMKLCEWCSNQSDQLTPIRDWEEHGSFSPRESQVCLQCVEKHRQGFESASAEWAAYMEPRCTATG